MTYVSARVLPIGSGGPLDGDVEAINLKLLRSESEEQATESEKPPKQANDDADSKGAVEAGDEAI